MPTKIRINYIFNLINGLSYMCLGETVIILLAVKIKSPDAIVAVLGSMSFFGYLMLPLGKKLTSHVGAVKTQAETEERAIFIS